MAEGPQDGTTFVIGSLDAGTFQALFHATTDAILWADLETGRVIECNRASEGLLGRSREEILGLHQTELHPEDLRDACAAIFRRHGGGPPASPAETEILQAQGARVPVSIQATVLDLGGRRVIQGIFRDISESRRAAEALARSEEKYRRLIESLRQGYFFYRHDAEGTFTYISPSISEVLGYTPDEFLTHYTEYLPPGPGAAAVIRHTDASLRGERQPAYEVEILKRDGELCILEVLEEPVLDDAGHVASVEGIAHDITNRKRIERELSESRRRIETLMANLPGMAYRCRNDPDWTMEFASQGCLGLTGHPPEDLLAGRVHYGSLILEEDREPVWTGVQQAVEGRQPFELLYRIRTRNGAVKWIWEKGRGVFRADGTLLALEGFLTDISDRRKAEAALAESEQRSRALIEKINDCVFTISRGPRSTDLRVEYVGPQIGAMTGFAAEAIVADPLIWIRGVHPDDVAQAVGPDHALWREPGRQRRLYRFRHALTGSWHWMSDTLESHADPDGVVRRIFGVVRDVTEAKEAEESLRRSRQELSTYHDLITHDLSNFAMKLLGILELLLTGAAGPLSAAQEHLLRTANRQALELDRMAENARLWSRIESSALPAATPTVSLGEVVDRAVEIARSAHFDRPFTLERDIPDGLSVAGVPFLENILLNLLDNAVRYGPPDTRRVAIVARASSGARVTLWVRGGVLEDPQFPARAFQRYVRGTRSTGSGLGLAVAREIVTHAGGEITARAVPENERSICEIILELPAAP